MAGTAERMGLELCPDDANHIRHRRRASRYVGGRAACVTWLGEKDDLITYGDPDVAFGEG